MKAPHEKPVIQIDVTNRCEQSCSNCTRMLLHHPRKFAMSVENFRLAAESLRDYPGVVGVFGGNPCLHPQFDALCAILRHVIPERRRRGLWSNHPRQWGKEIAETFGYLNLNVHGDAEAAAAFRAALGPNQLIWGDPRSGRECWHSPTMVSIQEVIRDEKAMWEAIEKCDINLYWSGAITEIGGSLVAYFCEVAAAFAHVYGDGTGLPVTPGWWSQPIDAYAAQVRAWCPQCGVPLKLRGHLDHEATDDVSPLHLPVIQARHGGRRAVALHTDTTAPGSPRTHRATDYMGIAPGAPEARP